MVVELTFFHDVICPYCYVQNLRLKRVLASFDRNEVRVIHKAFAIISDLDALKSVAFTEEEAREVFFKEFEIIKRYVPDYDLEGVKKRAKFSYVWSVPPLRACKAAEILGGNEAHGRFFEEAQKAFFEEGLDVTDEGVLANIAEKVGFEQGGVRPGLPVQEEPVGLRGGRSGGQGEGYQGGARDTDKRRVRTEGVTVGGDLEDRDRGLPAIRRAEKVTAEALLGVLMNP